jgi:dCMP deaminase
MSRWDSFFLRIAEAAAMQSLCLNRQIGAVLVRDKRIISTGYNGPPEGVPECSRRPDTDPLYEVALGLEEWSGEVCPRRVLGQGHGEGREWCPATHAEVNAIINAARMGVSSAGATLYLTCGVPCKNCLSSIINAGIIEVVCTSFVHHDKLTSWILTFSKLRIRTYA